MINKQELARELLENTVYLVATLSNVREADIDRKPSSLAWSPAEIAEHLVILEALAIRILQGRTKPVEDCGCDHDSDPAKKVEEIKSAFGDLEKKFTAAGPVAPLGMYKDKDILISKVRTNRQDLAEIVKTQDLTAVCVDFQHGIFGELTRLEWIYFIIYHTERHLRQISPEAATFLDSRAQKEKKSAD